MKRSSHHMRTLPVLLLACCLAVLLYGCTEEKATALQVAAKQFNNEAQAAIDLYESFCIATVATPQESLEEKAADIIEQIKKEKKRITAKSLNRMMDTGFENLTAIKTLETAFDNLRIQYSKFYSMYHTLEKGSYFASDQVKKGEHLAAKLTLQLISFAKKLSSTEGYMYTGKRMLVIEQINAARDNKDDTELTYAVKAMLDIQSQERTAKEAIITQLLKASEAGKVVTESIKQYSSLSANDILDAINASLGLFDTYGKTNTEINSMLEKYGKYAETVRKDPYWSAILDMKFN